MKNHKKKKKSKVCDKPEFGSGVGYARGRY